MAVFPRTQVREDKERQVECRIWAINSIFAFPRFDCRDVNEFKCGVRVRLILASGLRLDVQTYGDTIIALLGIILPRELPIHQSRRSLFVGLLPLQGCRCERSLAVLLLLQFNLFVRQRTAHESRR